MGTIKKGILGGFSGKVGTVIGTTWRGLDVIRSLPKKTGGQPTAAQHDQRLKFATIVAFLHPISNVLSRYFGSPSGSLSKLNAAVSYHNKAAITGISPNFTVNFSQVLIAKGDLAGVANGVLTSPVPATVHVGYEDNSGQALASTDDVLLVVAYNPVKASFLVEESKATRHVGSVSINVPTEFTGDTVHVWATFVHSTLKKAATSSYLGTIIIS